MKKKKIVVLTGAGVSEESGISTFRDQEGLWEKHKVEEVATLKGWENNKELVLNFYNQRRQELNEVEPNIAHELIAKLEDYFEVTVITQNVDDLHERAGSTQVIHLHGELRKARSTANPDLIYHWNKDLNPGDLCEEKSQLRPHIIWFGERLNGSYIDAAKITSSEAEVMIIIGTSLKVSPANELPYYTPSSTPIYLIDINARKINLEDLEERIFKINDRASSGTNQIFETLKAAIKREQEIQFKTIVLNQKNWEKVKEKFFTKTKYIEFTTSNIDATTDYGEAVSTAMINISEFGFDEDLIDIYFTNERFDQYFESPFLISKLSFSESVKEFIRKCVNYEDLLSNDQSIKLNDIVFLDHDHKTLFWSNSQERKGAYRL